MKLEEEGWTTFKCAIWSKADYVCIKRIDGELKVKLIEAKKTKNKQFRVNTHRLRKQLGLLEKVANKLEVPAEYYIKEKGKFIIIPIERMGERIGKRKEKIKTRADIRV